MVGGYIERDGVCSFWAQRSEEVEGPNADAPIERSLDRGLYKLLSGKQRS